MSQTYPWFPAYRAAVLETDDGKLPNRILKAERALGQRAEEPEVDSSELHAIQNAFDALRTLRNERTQPSSSISSIAIQPPSVGMEEYFAFSCIRDRWRRQSLNQLRQHVIAKMIHVVWRGKELLAARYTARRHDSATTHLENLARNLDTRLGRLSALGQLGKTIVSENRKVDSVRVIAAQKIDV